MQGKDESLSPDSLQEELKTIRQYFADQRKQIENSFKESENIVLSNVSNLYGNYTVYNYATDSKEPMSPDQVNQYLVASLEINKEKNFFLEKENKLYAKLCDRLYQAYNQKIDQYDKLEAKLKEQPMKNTLLLEDNPLTSIKMKEIEKENEEIMVKLISMSEQNQQIKKGMEQREEKMSQFLFNTTQIIRKNIQQASSVIISQEETSKGSFESQAKKLDRNVKKLLKVQTQISNKYKMSEQKIETLNKQLLIEQKSVESLQNSLQKVKALESKIQQNLTQITEDRNRIQREYSALIEMRQSEEDSEIWLQSEVEALNNLNDIVRSKKERFRQNYGRAMI